MDLKEKIKNFPAKPGVYIMHDQANKIIYIGKAKQLKNRISSYFINKTPDVKTQILVSKIADIEYIITDNEVEALILEDTLIKKHLPKYNVALKDDKRYPYIKITTSSDTYPHITLTREHKNDKDLYFGPYTSVKPVRHIVQMLNRLFPLRKCNKNLNTISGHKAKAVGKVCLNYQIGLCSGPCQGNVPQKEYNKVVEQIVLFLKGENSKLVECLNAEMKYYSDQQNYEKAKIIRDRIRAIELMMDQQKIISEKTNSKDFLFIANDENIYNITLLFIREGKLIGKDNFIINNTINDEQTILNNFIKQFYLLSTFLPEEIIVPFKIEDALLFPKVLKEEKNVILKIKTPENELEQKLLKMAEENCTIELSNYMLDQESKNVKKQIKELKKVLKLKRHPDIIEGFDISDIQGKFPVGSMVRFKKGMPEKKEYRKFKIKTVEGIDDFKMIAEIVLRRYKRLKNEQKQMPDLILIDGGALQLQSALQSLNSLELTNIPIIGLAKKEEEIYLPNQERPLQLSKYNTGLKLLQKVRDEAHRFAITFHKDLRSKDLIKRT